MGWQFSDDVTRYADRVWDLLAAHPDSNTLPLTVIEYVRSGKRWGPGRMLFGWWEDAGVVHGAVSMTPPYELVLAEVPGPALQPLVEQLRRRGDRLPGVTGERSLAERFAAAWTEGTDLTAAVNVRTRLYALDRLVEPSPPPPGRARAAGPGDQRLVTRWYDDFHSELDLPGDADNSVAVRSGIADGRVWLWESPDGTPVSLAGRHPTAARIARIGPVYTVPEHRRHGYGAAVTAVCTRDALDRDADQAVLFTDLANPTSNEIYQRIGYRPMRDQVALRFEAVSAASAPPSTSSAPSAHATPSAPSNPSTPFAVGGGDG